MTDEAAGPTGGKQVAAGYVCCFWSFKFLGFVHRSFRQRHVPWGYRDYIIATLAEPQMKLHREEGASTQYTPSRPHFLLAR